MHDHAFPVEAAFDALGLAEPETEDSAVWHVVAAMVSAVEAGLHEMDVDSGDGRALDAAGASRPGVVRRRVRSGPPVVYCYAVDPEQRDRSDAAAAHLNAVV